ncbi:amino acid adenylation domain-containing protein [Polaribacter sp.]|uniref:amino acid adenylation domain-containing protein n=1 Tax=Polaribacter sp. TaxID=1920175 RepID=UPI003EF5D887
MNEPTLEIYEVLQNHALNIQNSVAVICDGKEISYGDLEKEISEMRRGLTTLQFDKNETIGIHLERSPEFLIASIALMSLNRAYVFIPPDSPKDRMMFILEDMGIRQVIANDENKEFQLMNVQTHSVSDLMQKGELHSGNKDTPFEAADEIVYTIYTSGTTGKPKGIAIRKDGLNYFMNAFRGQMKFTSRDVFLAQTSFAFDPHVVELFIPLILGSTIVLAAKHEVGNPDNLTQLIDKCKVTLIQGTPSFYRQMLNNGWKIDHSIRLFCGGEAMTEAMKNELLDLGKVELWNLYGPTETTVWATATKVERDIPVLIGNPIDGTEYYVLNDQFVPVKIDETGEVFISSPGLMKGYVGQDELTQKAIVDINLNGKQLRLFRTGDLVRRKDDQSVQFVERRDLQVKVNGYRIELIEIEQVLSACNGIQEAYCVVEGNQLVTCLKTYEDPQDEGAFIRELTETIAVKLPKYMIPLRFMRVDSVPLGTTGKVDRKSIARLFKLPQSQKEDQKLSGEFQMDLFNIWKEVVSIEGIVPSESSNFFALGGNSINVVLLKLKIFEKWSVNVTVNDLISNENIGQMGMLIKEKMKKDQAHLHVFDYRKVKMHYSQRVMLIEQSRMEISSNNLEVLLEASHQIDAVTIALSKMIEHYRVFSALELDLESQEIVFDKRPQLTLINAGSDYTSSKEFVENLETYRKEIDPFEGVFSRIVVYPNGEKTIIYLACNHFIIDGISFRVLRNNLEYLLRCEENILPPSPDYCDWLEQITSEDAERSTEYCNTLLSDYDVAIPSSIKVKKTEGEAVQMISFPNPFKGIAIKETFNYLLTTSALSVMEVFELKSALSRIVLSGRGEMESMDDTATVGWLAYHFPFLIKYDSDPFAVIARVEQFHSLMKSKDAWYEFLQQKEQLGHQLESDFPVYFNFIPDITPRSGELDDLSDLLPPFEARSSLNGVGFVFKEQREEIQLFVYWDEAKIDNIVIDQLIESWKSNWSKIEQFLIL